MTRFWHIANAKILMIISTQTNPRLSCGISPEEYDRAEWVGAYLN